MYSGMKGFLTSLHNKLIRKFEGVVLTESAAYRTFNSNVRLISNNNYYKKKNINNTVSFFLNFTKFLSTDLFSSIK